MCGKYPTVLFTISLNLVLRPESGAALTNVRECIRPSTQLIDSHQMPSLLMLSRMWRLVDIATHEALASEFNHRNFLITR